MLNGKVIDKDGNELWYRDGVLHREDEPAIVVNAEVYVPTVYGMSMKVSKGTKAWLFNGVLHRNDAPAVEYWNGARSWYVHGQLHREDGPAQEYNVDGREYKMFGHTYWLNGFKLTKEEFEKIRLSKALPENNGASSVFKI